MPFYLLSTPSHKRETQNHPLVITDAKKRSVDHLEMCNITSNSVCPTLVPSLNRFPHISILIHKQTQRLFYRILGLWVNVA